MLISLVVSEVEYANRHGLGFHAIILHTLCKYYKIVLAFLVNNSAQFFLVCLFLFSTCLGQSCAHHQENDCIHATPGLCHSV